MAEAKRPAMAAAASHIANEASGAAGLPFDPTAIIAMIQALLAMFTNCGKTPAQALDELHNPGLLTWLMVMKQARSRYPNHHQAEVLAHATLDYAATVNEDTYKALQAEAK